MRKTRVTVRETVSHSTQPFSQHNFRLYGCHIEFWNHLRNKVLHPLITQIYSAKVIKAFFFKLQGVAEQRAKNWPGVILPPPGYR